jgi:hypothetical protein
MFLNEKKLVQNLIREMLLREARQVGDQEARELMKKFSKGLQTIGIQPDSIDSLKNLAAGTRGVVYDLGDRVLKITPDENEAAAASMIAGKDLPSLARYYDVVRLGDTGVYALTLENLDPLSDEEGKKFNNALVKTRLPLFIVKAGYDFDKAKELTKQFIKSDLEKKYKSGKLDVDGAKAEYNQFNEVWNYLSKQYNIRGLCETFGKLGIDFHDYHAGNFMLRKDGTLVLVDPGMSKIKGSPGEIKTISEMFRRLGRKF